MHGPQRHIQLVCYKMIRKPLFDSFVSVKISKARNITLNSIFKNGFQNIKNLEKFVLSQERESYVGVQERIDRIKQKYQALRDQKIRERIQELGIQTTDSDTRADLLEKERQYNFDRQKIEFALESYYRSCVSCVYALNKKWIPKKMSLLRVLDYRFEDSSIYIKYDEDPDEKWLMLIYIKDNNPDQGIIVEDKTNSEKNISFFSF